MSKPSKPASQPPQIRSHSPIRYIQLGKYCPNFDSQVDCPRIWSLCSFLLVIPAIHRNVDYPFGPVYLDALQLPQYPKVSAYTLAVVGTVARENGRLPHTGAWRRTEPPAPRPRAGDPLRGLVNEGPAPINATLPPGWLSRHEPHPSGGVMEPSCTEYIRPPARMHVETWLETTAVLAVER